MDELLIALDVDTLEQARRLADSLRGLVGGYKVGNQLFTRAGPQVVRELVERGDRVFLDLKYHDIPNTVAGAIGAAAALGVWMVDVHTSGGPAMMRMARARAEEVAARHGATPPLVIGITVLTSFDEPALAEIGVRRPMTEQVQELARMAQAAGLDGVVASAHEIAAVRAACGADFTIVTPGIRDPVAPEARPQPTSRSDDQRRTMTAREAIDAGADYIVVGRPIIATADPRAAAERLIHEAAGERRGKARGGRREAGEKRA